MQSWQGPWQLPGRSRHLWVFWETNLIGFMSQKVRVSETGLAFAIRTQTPLLLFGLWFLCLQERLKAEGGRNLMKSISTFIFGYG